MAHDWGRLAARFDELLQLETPAVAVALSLEPPPGVAPLAEGIRLCQMIDKARFERVSFHASNETHSCDGGAYHCGLRESSEGLHSGRFLSLERGLLASPRAGRRHHDTSPTIETGSVSFTAFGPAAAAAFEPDVLVVVGTPLQGMRLVEASAYETGLPVDGLTGPPICAAVVAAPFLDGQMVYNLGDGGSRRNAQISDHEIYVGIPAEMLEQLVAALEALENRPR